jgi:hypothetical protein
MYGAEERSRTADTRIFSPLLYHLSYLGIRDIVGFRQFQCQASAFVIIQSLPWVNDAGPAIRSVCQA